MDDTADMGKKLLELSASNTRDAVHRNVKAHYDFLSKVAKETKKNLDQEFVYTHKHANVNLADTLRRTREDLNQKQCRQWARRYKQRIMQFRIGLTTTTSLSSGFS